MTSNRTAFSGKRNIFGGKPPDVLKIPPSKRPLGWRERVLATLPPLSAEAFFICREPFSEVERESRQRDLDAIQRQIEELPPLEDDETPPPTSAMNEFCFDIAAECDVVCAALMRPQVLDGTGLRPIHFFDRALAELFRLCDYLHVKESVARPFNLIPARLEWRSWWRESWEGDGRAIFMMILECHGEADAAASAKTVIELAHARGVA